MKQFFSSGNIKLVFIVSQFANIKSHFPSFSCSREFNCSQTTINFNFSIYARLTWRFGFCCAMFHSSLRPFTLKFCARMFVIWLVSSSQSLLISAFIITSKRKENHKMIVKSYFLSPSVEGWREKGFELLYCGSFTMTLGCPAHVRTMFIRLN